MIAELKRTVVPVLRELGFRGSFPHFRRVSESQVELLTFQFSSGGGEFVVEIGKFPPEGYELYGQVIPSDEVKMMHLLGRMRLGAMDGASDHWFNYEGGNYGEVAASVVPYLRGQALEWWRRA
jgi:Domain of unknown function (DUF4304)